MKAATYVFLCAVILAGCTASVSAQAIISAKSGTINYIDGKVLLDSKEVRLKATAPQQLKAGQEIQAADGRAELLLGPGTFLRLGENSSARMISDRLEDTRLELLSGSAIVECVELQKDNAVTLSYKDATMSLAKKGLYRLDAEPAQFSVYDGEARVDQRGQTQVIKRSRRLPLDGVSIAEKFNNKTGDSLLRWTRQRAEYLALANQSAAIHAGRGLGSSWIWCPSYGMYTFVPGRGYYNSFWGYRYWSPHTIWEYYAPQPSSSWDTSGGGSRGYSTVAATPSGTSGTAAVSAPPTAASSSSSNSTVSRGSGSSSGTRR